MQLRVSPENPLEWLALQTNNIPIPLLHVQMYFVMAKAVMEAADAGVFECIGHNKKTVEEIATQCQLNVNALSQLLNLMVSMEYLKHENSLFSMTNMAKKWILPESADSVHDIAVYNNRVVWDWVGQMGQYLRTGVGMDSHEVFDKDQWQLYQSAMRSVAMGEVREFMKRVSIPKNAKKVLDIGGANAQHAIALCKKYPHLSIDILDLPEAFENAPDIGNLSIKLIKGNALTYDFGVEVYDMVLMSNLAHHLTAQQNELVAQKVAKALRGDGVFVINEFIRPELDQKPELVGSSSNLFFGITSTSGNWTTSEIQTWQKRAKLIPQRVKNYLTIPGMAMVGAKKTLSLFFLLFTSCFSLAQNSVLADGQWFKIGITRTSVYRLDATFFKNIGLNPASINPKNIQIFGNAGAMLPQPNDQARANDLTENAIFVKGETDGKFDEGDAVWFFGQSPHEIKLNSAEFLEHQLNLYSDTTFYFLKIGNKSGQRLQNQASGKSGFVVNTFDDYVFRENEITNKIQSGREWWGEYFGINTQQNIDFNLAGVVPNSPFRLTVSSVAAAQVTTKFNVSLNGQGVGTQSMATVSTYRYDYKGQKTIQAYKGSTSSSNNKMSVGLNFDKNGQANAEGYLDFLGVQAVRNLQTYEQPTVFQNIVGLQKDSVQYVIAQANNSLQLWDITNPLQPANQSYMLSGQNASFVAAGKILKKFIAFNESQLQNPAYVVEIPNQNLHALPTPQFLIVTSSVWQKQAQQLANFRQKNDGLSMLVATTQQIYNEFSSGRLDPTAIRDFVKYLNDRQPNRLKYLLLFGDATYDYKNNNQTQNAVQLANFVPTYESYESASPVYSYSSDDYFGFLKPSDGTWSEDYNGAQNLDIGIGRLPVKSADEATIVVNKLIRYATKNTTGRWRQRVCFVADDGDANIHQQDAEDLSKIISKNAPQYEIKKLFVDAFSQNSNPSGQRAPDVNKNIDQNANEGVLVMNYTGHGGVSGWAEEQILTLSDLLNWRNIDNMPLLVTATCEFGRTDDPGVVSGAELAVLSPRGGAIGLLTTTRPVFANTNFLLNQAFYKAVFQPIDEKMPRLGDVFRITKNNSQSGVLNRNFMLMADPSMRLNYAEYQAILTTVNDTLKAGKIAKLNGEIRSNNQLVSDFNGTANVSIFDKENQLLTQGTESSKMAYSQYLNKIFEGKVSVKSGKFSVQFVVPKNIDYRLGRGRIQVYALSSDSLKDAADGTTQIWVGGSELLATDNKPPTLQMYLNNEDFKDGSETDENPVFFAKIADENGLNLSHSGIGNDMIMTLNDTLSIVVNDYFSAVSDDYKTGVIRYPFQKLPAGNYNLKLKIWDTYNNATENSLRFSVVNRSTIIKRLVVYPNPFNENVFFEMSPFEEGDDFEIKMMIVDMTGKIVKEFSAINYNTDANTMIFNWNGTNQSNETVPNGQYLYKIIARSLTQPKSQYLAGKLGYKR